MEFFRRDAYERKLITFISKHFKVVQQSDDPEVGNSIFFYYGGCCVIGMWLLFLLTHFAYRAILLH